MNRAAALPLHGFALVTCGLACGCLGAVPTLAVRHVVVYRNGVAFFEREGHVKGTRAGFRTRPTGVSDVLATLAVSDEGPDRGVPAVRSVALEDRDAAGAETVVLALDGKPHDLDVGYIAESPIWKPSYRLILHAGRDAHLQIWAVVENTSGEDWKEVGLSLVTGAPVAYESDLDARVVPQRPMVNGSVPQPMGVPDSVSSYGYRAAQNQSMQVSASYTSGATVSHVARSPYALSRPIVQSADGPRVTTGVSMRGSSTRYDLALPVSIADQSASMVMVEDRALPATQVLLYEPDDAVVDSATHPFRAIRFENRTEGALESGPVALFDGASFLGQAVVGGLPAGGSGTVPYALERDVTTTREARAGETSGPLAVTPSGPTMRRERETRTVYHLESELDRPASVVLRHERAAGTRLVSPPAGTEEGGLRGAALVPVTLAARGTADVVLVESAPVTTAIDWLAPAADSAVKAFLADPNQAPEVVKKLGAAWSLRAELLKVDEERSALRLASYDLAREGQGRKHPDVDAKVADNARRMEAAEARYDSLKQRFQRALAETRLPAPP